MRNHLLVHVNGVPHRIGAGSAFQTLSRFLRYEERATGTKIVCEEGDCGACTVLVGRLEKGALRYRPVNSCIQLMFQLDGTHVVTVEGLRSGEALTPVQEAMVRCHGAQCGYCTPGFVVAMTAVFEESSDRPSREEVKNAISGNLCRCTGYDSIVNAALEVDPAAVQKIEQLYPGTPIIQEIERNSREPLRVGHFFRPVDVADAVAFKAENPSCTVIQGATDVGVWWTKRGFRPEAILSLDGIEGLEDLAFADDDGTLLVGARATLASVAAAIVDRVPQLGAIFERFGSPQIRNAGTLAGNIANASPIADSLPFLFVAGASLELTGGSGVRVVPIDQFYLGYKKLALASDEIITRVRIPLPTRADTLRLYKVSKRSHLDIATFTAGFLMRVRSGRVESIRIAFGGVAPVVMRLPKTEALLTGRPFALDAFAAAAEVARTEVAPISDVRGTREFRLQLAENALLKFYYDAAGASSEPSLAMVAES